MVNRLSIVLGLILATYSCSKSNKAGGGSQTQVPAGPKCDFIAPDNLTLKTEHNFQDQLEVKTKGIWAVWWDPKFDHTADANALIEQLEEVRCDVTTNYSMQDPPNVAKNTYFNVFIHHSSDDMLPEAWGNGVGTDSFGNPYLTLPDGIQSETLNTKHEGFHIFQYNTTAPGFAYEGDAQWYTETSAQWYSVRHIGDGLASFIQVGAIEGNPQLTIWHSFSNHASGDPTDWMYQVRQYGMHSMLYYITEVLKAAPEPMTDGFYSNASSTPQQYLYEAYGADNFRSYFTDWAAHNTADFDYLLPEQVERARQEVDSAGDRNNFFPFVAEYNNQGTGGQWLAPPTNLLPRSWSYNVVRIANTEEASYTFSVKGEASGSQGGTTHLDGRIVVMGSDGPKYTSLTMASTTEGTASATVTPTDTEIFLVIASVPEVFRGNQTYNYQYKIEKN